MGVDIIGRLRRLKENDHVLRFLDYRSEKLAHKVTAAANRSRGGTALHDAIAGGNLRLAASLLVDGIDVSKTDDSGLAALASEFVRPETLHLIRQYYQCERCQTHQQTLSASPELAEVAERGIVKLPNFVSGDTLEQLRHEFSGFVTALEHRIRKGEALMQRYHEEEHYWPDDTAYISNNAFAHSPTLVEVACRPFVIELATQYFGKRTHIQRAGAMRYLPGGRTGHNMFAWHHDLEGRRLKLMILLTEVSKQDHSMGYVVGSNNIDHPWTRYQTNSLSLDYCARRLGNCEIVETIGSPGDAFIFDSNGAHIGNRRSTARTRDVYMVEYNCDPSNVYGGDIPESALAMLDAKSIDALATFRACPRRWERTDIAGTSWVHNLFRVEKWLSKGVQENEA